MPPMPELNQRIEHLLAQAALFRLLAQGFSYPEAGHVAELGAAFSRGRAVWEACGESADERRPGVPNIRRAFSAARRAWQEADAARLQADYVRLFLSNAPCPLRETAYGDGGRIAGRAVELADVAGFYAAFGFQLSDSDPDLPDHLATELEFYSLLLVKQAYALASHWPERERVAARAAASFLGQHLGRWTGVLAERLREHGAPAPYLSLCALLQAMIEAECKRLRTVPERLHGRLPHDPMQDEAFVCPRAEEAAGGAL